MSHIKVWREIQRRQLKSAMIFEDDAVLCDNFDARFMQSWTQVPDDWNFVNVGCISGCGDRENYTAIDWGNTAIVKVSDWFYKIRHRGGDRVSNGIAVPDGPTGTHCYVISNKGSAILLEQLEKLPFMGHIDIMINTYGRDKLNRYAFTDGAIVSQPLTTESSTIGTGGPPYFLNWIFDKIPLNKRGMNFGWVLSESGFRLGPFDFSAWHAIFIVAAVILALKTKSPTSVWLITGVLLTDLFVFGKEKHILKALFLIGMFCGTYFLVRRSK